MKHRSLILMLILIISLLILCLTPVTLFYYAGIARYYVEFDACAEELEQLVQFLQENQCGCSWLSVNLVQRTLHCPVHGYLVIPTQLQTVLSRISTQGFVCKDAQWETIRFQDGRMQLDIVNGQYALVYSPDGRPDYLHSPEEDRRILVRHIDGDWYHVSNLP